MVWFGGQSRASTTSIEDFEDGSTWDNEWSGSPTNFSNQQTTVQEGNWALRTADGPNGPGDGVDHDTFSPSTGNEYRFAFHAAGDADPIIMYALQDYSNMYHGRVNVSDNDFDLWVKDAGSDTALVSGEAVGETVSQDTWYYFGVRWTDSNGHTLVLYDSSLSEIATTTEATDSTHSGGAVGLSAWGANTTDDCIFDEYVEEPL